MRRNTRNEIIAGLAVSTLLAILFVVWARKPAVSTGEDPEQRRATDALIKAIKRESVDKSYKILLTDGDEYRLGWGPVQSMSEEILSSRRAVKVLQTVEKMPNAKRIEKCRELFQRAMQENKDVFDAGFRSKEEPGFSAPFRLIPNRAIGLAMLATAETGRRDILAEQFRQLDEFRAYLTARIAKHESLYGAREIDLVDDTCVPDNRLLVNVLRLAALRDSTAGNLVERVDAYLESAGMIRTEILVTSWNARTTSFEVLIGSPPDTSKGATHYQFYQWPWDEFRQNRSKELQVLAETKRLVLAGN